jgi:hypothetical protein
MRVRRRGSRASWGGALLAGVLLAISGGAVATAAPTAWEPVAAPQPPNQLGHMMGSVSCPTTSFCMAVGTNAIENYSEPLAETFGGTSWTLRHPLRSQARAQFDGVSCVSATDCTAVGEVFASDESDSQLLAEQWNGRTWRVETTPTFSGGSTFTTVSCPSTSTCFASGSRSGGKGFIERWQSGGKGWSATLISPSLWAGISGISCVSSTDCVAVGSGSLTRDGSPQGLVETWNGSTWTDALSLPAADALFGVSCTSATSCVAVGTSLTGHHPISVVLSGATWTVHDLSVASSSEAALRGVACVSATSCTAVGYAATSTSSRAIAEHWNATTWAAESVVQEKSSLEPVLAGVSCRPGSSCEAVGSYVVSPVKGFGQVNLLVEQGPEA